MLFHRREAENATRDAKKNLSKKSSADVRLNRALEDAAKLKGINWLTLTFSAQIVD